MASVKAETKSPFPIGDEKISVLAYCKPRRKSVMRSFWDDHVGAVENFFEGGTSEEQEDKALKILMRAESFGELGFMVERLSWDVLDDELDEEDLTGLAGRISALRNRDENAVDKVLRSLALEPTTFAKTPWADVDAAIVQRVTWLGDLGQAKLATQLIDRRAALLDSIALFSLRGLDTRARELRVLLDDLAGRLPGMAGDLLLLRWDVFYDARVCMQLEQARYRLLIVQTLPDLVDPTLPAVRRRALFDTLNRRDAEFRAMQDFITVMGTAQQRTDVARFMDGRGVFLDNFTPTPPKPAVIGAVAGFFDSVATNIADLRADIANASRAMIDSLTLEHLTGADSDDTSREAVGVLDGAGRLAVLPTQWKAALVRRMEEGNADDDDEQAILQVLRASKERSLADFAQLIQAQGWETLSFSFDGQETDDLEGMLSSW